MGRKISLKDIRKEMLTDHQKFMRLTSDSEYEKMSKECIINTLKSINEYEDSGKTKQELLNTLKSFQRTRSLMFWHDGSTISNHSYLLIMVNTIYDNALFYTDEEYYEMHKSKINIQSVVEKPYVYILAQCPSNDQQILYTEERISDIVESSIGLTVNNMTIHDKIRFFKGDMPASQFEAGHQKGGNYFCTGCAIKAEDVSTLQSPGKFLSLHHKAEKLRESTLSIEKLGKKVLKLYDNLDKADLISELRERKIKFTSTAPIQHLRELLTIEMHGIQRLPALMYDTPHSSLCDLRLQDYEILCNEPLHDVSNHIKNLYAEIPNHLTKAMKQKVQEVIACSFNGKSAKNSSDYRKSLLVLSNWFNQNHSNNIVSKLLITMAEIQEILYSPENERSLTSILRLYNLTFLHSILLKLSIDKKKMKGTERKLYGGYFHNLMCHSPDQLRIVSGRASNTEKEEATFNTIKTDTKLASNHHSDNVIINAMIRIQARKVINNTPCSNKNNSYVTELYKPISTSLTNTLVPFRWIKSHSREYQCLLQRQADYLLDGKWWQETTDGVLFFDKNNIPKNTMLRMKHFRSTNISSEMKYVETCWHKCLEDKNTLIPAYKLHLYDNKIQQTTITILTLKFFRGEFYHESDLTEESESSIEPSQVEESIPEQQPTQSPKIPLPKQKVASTPKTFHSSGSKIISDTPTYPISNFITTPSKLHYEEDIFTLKKKIPPPSELQNKTVGKTTNILLRIFGEKQFVHNYDKARKNLKAQHTATHQSNYHDVLAIVETKLSSEYSILQEKLKNLEFLGMQENETLSTVPLSTSNKDSYNGILQILKFIKLLRSELKLSFPI